MKHYRHYIAMFLVLLMMFTFLPFQAVATDNQTMTTNGDVVLVLDDTGSMKYNDPNKAAKQAIEQFLLNTPVNGSNLGVVTFSDKVMAQYPMTQLNETTRASVEAEMKAFAAENITWEGEWTDLVVGLKAAVEMLTALPESDNIQAIIAVTDGANDFRKSERNSEISNKELAELEAVCEEKGIRIYLIGLNLDENSVRAYLNGIAGVTGGTVEFVDTADELGAKISAVYEDLGIITKTDTGDEQFHVGEGGVDISRTIPENVFEAIFDISHTSPISVFITDPDGNVLDSSTMSFSSSDTKTVVKLREPTAGPYILHIDNTSVLEQDVLLSTYHNSEVFVEVTAPAAVEIQTDFDVSASLVRGTEQYQHSDLQNLKASLVLTNGQDTVQQELTLDGDRFTGTVQLPTAGDWEAVVTIASDRGFNRSNDTIPIITANAASAPAAAPEPISPWLIVLIVVAVLLIVAGILVWINLPKITDVPKGTIQVSCHTDMAQRWTVSLTARKVFSKLGDRLHGCGLMDAINTQSAHKTLPLDMSSAERDRCEKIVIQLRKCRAKRNSNGSKYELVMIDNGNPRTDLNNHFEVNNDDSSYIETKWM